MTGDHHNATGDAAETDRGLGGSQVSPGNLPPQLVENFEDRKIPATDGTIPLLRRNGLG